MRRRSLLPPLVLALALLAGAVPAGAAICDDAERCAIPTAAASCRAAAVVYTPSSSAFAPTEAHVMTAPGNESEILHLAQANVAPTFPSINIHVGAVESFCQAYTTPAGLRKACGRATIEDLLIDLNPVARVVIQIWGLVAEGCSAAGAELGAYNSAWYERGIIAVENGTGPVAIPMGDESVMLGPGTRLALNTEDRTLGSCMGSDGAAVHIETTMGDIAIGWVSTGACS